MSAEPPAYDQLKDFTCRPLRPDLEPHFSPKGIGLGTHMDPRKLANLLGKVSAKSRAMKGGKPKVATKTVIAHGNRK